MNEPRGVRIAIGFGSPQGDRASHLETGRVLLAARGVKWTAISQIYETAPVGPDEQTPFLNQAAIGETDLPARALLEVCQQIEQESSATGEAGTLYLTILLYGDREMRIAGLAIPPLEMKQKASMLIPLAEIGPKLRIPGTNGTVADRAQLAAGREGVRIWRSFATKPLTQAE